MHVAVGQDYSNELRASSVMMIVCMLIVLSAMQASSRLLRDEPAEDGSLDHDSLLEAHQAASNPPALRMVSLEGSNVHPQQGLQAAGLRTPLSLATRPQQLQAPQKAGRTMPWTQW